ncbi:MAG: DMT family transporter [Chloroflexi bacterium]|nr:DMT family transporter [Chloroflexota bacterium]
MLGRPASDTDAGPPARWTVYLSLLVAAFLWGSLYPAAKPAVAATGPIQVTLCRVALAFVALGTLSLLRGGPRPIVWHVRRHGLTIVVLGLMNFSLSQIMALSALAFLPASIVGVLNNTHPLWVAIAAAGIARPRRPALMIAASLVALAGVVLVFAPDLIGGAADASAVQPIGVALALGGSLAIAASTLLGSRVMAGSDPVIMSALASGAAIVPMLGLTLVSGGFAPIVQADASIKVLLLYLGVGCTAINFGLWFYGLKYLPAAAASAFQYLIPPISVALAAIFLAEPISPSLVLGTLCILIGLAATQLATGRLAVSGSGAS